LIGTLCILETLAYRQADGMKSGAGMNIRRYEGDVQSQGYDTDMRNFQRSQRSQKLNIQIKLNKTPIVVEGNIEKFGSITDMICDWEGKEETERVKNVLTVEGVGRKKHTKVVR
jgi:hypothetical protein